MAINKQEFTIQVDTNLKSTKDSNKFYINFKVNGKRTEKVLDYSDKDWDKRTRLSKAKQVLIELKEKVTNSGTNISTNSTLNQIAEMYFNQRENTKWTNYMKQDYDVHIKDKLGKKKVTAIKRVDIDQLKTSMSTKGKTKQTENGCSPRTIQKVLKNILKPILEYAYKNDIIDKVPSIEVPSVNNKPKPVPNPQETFTNLYAAITSIYDKDPFFRAIFLLALFGRRQNEIFSLEWNSIDFSNGTYTIKGENNKVKQDQTYMLPEIISKALLELGISNGIVFKSPVSGDKLKDIRAQVNKIAKASGVEQLTMHYFRNVLVSMLATRPDVSPNMLAASLGHLDLQTSQKHYITKDHLGASKAITNIINTQIEG